MFTHMARGHRWGARRPVNLTMATGTALVGLVVLAALVGATVPPHDPIAIDIQHRLLPPSAQFPLGTDQYGRDILSRVLAGAPLALSAGLVAVAIAAGVGVPVGLLSGFHTGLSTEIVLRAVDALQAFPTLLLAIIVVAALGPSLVNAMLAIGLVGIPPFVRITRAVVLSLREREFILAAQASGATTWRVLQHHILPNTLSPLLVQVSVSFANALLAEAGLSYLGLGTQPPLPSWGRMLDEARTFMSQAPWMAIAPGTAIAIAILGFNLLADGLRDYLDPQMRRADTQAQ